MARRKQTVIQRDMSLMEIREEFLERGDTDLRSLSLKGARNMKVTQSGAIEARWGLRHVAAARDTSELVRGFTTGDGLRWEFKWDSDRIQISSLDGGLSQIAILADNQFEGEFPPFFVQVGNGFIFGADGEEILGYEYDGSTFTSSSLLSSFIESTGGEKAQPYWAFESEVTIQPSALTGSITVTLSAANTGLGYAGTRIRYLGREIEITADNSTTELQGTVVNALPPTFQIGVGDASEYKVGDVVVGADTNYQGQIIAISGNNLDVVTLNFFDGPDIGENLVGPSGEVSQSSTGSGTPSTPPPTGKQEVTTKVIITPGATNVWDEQLISDRRGYPRSASFAGGRLVLSNFPQLRNGIAISSARNPFDFKIGAADDDALVRTIGQNGTQIRHTIDAGDLLIMTDKGLYASEVRGGSPLTPSNFNPVLFDARGIGRQAPVLVNDGVVFIDLDENGISAAVLDGNVYLKWSVASISDNHQHLIKSPVSLCGPALDLSETEKYVFVINGDGTLAAISYTASVAEQGVGIAPWDTNGSFLSVEQVHGEYQAIVERTSASGPQRSYEVFDPALYLDAAVSGDAGSPPSTSHLEGFEAIVMDGRQVHGTYLIGSGGAIPNEPAYLGTRYVGLDFEAEASPWAVQIIESVRNGVFDARCIRFLVSVQNTADFGVRCNNNTRTIGGYAFGDDLSVASPLRTKRYTVPVFGRRQNADLAVFKTTPGPFRILYLGQEVQS